MLIVAVGGVLLRLLSSALSTQHPVLSFHEIVAETSFAPELIHFGSLETFRVPRARELTSSRTPISIASRVRSRAPRFSRWRADRREPGV